jgi:hypothetical protein
MEHRRHQIAKKKKKNLELKEQSWCQYTIWFQMHFKAVECERKGWEEGRYDQGTLNACMKIE